MQRLHERTTERDYHKRMCDTLAARIEALEAALERCAKFADDFDCHLGGYPNEEAQQFYETGVLDASSLIAKHIRAALDKDADRD
jgi:hypothetical protein